MSGRISAQLINSHIERVRRRGNDDAQVEVKASVERLPKSIWDSVSAFANTDGGIIILGLNEEKEFDPADGFNPTKTMNALLAGFREGTDAKISPIPPHTIETIEVNGSFVVAVAIDPLRPISDARMPCFVKEKGIQRGSFKRVDDQDLKLSPYEIHILETLKTPSGLDKEPVPDVTLEDLSGPRMRAAFEALRNQGSHALDDIDTSDHAAALKRLNLMTRDDQITLAAYLVLGKYPQQQFPQLTVDVAIHPTSVRSELTNISTIDRRNCDGPIPLMIEDALSTVARNLNKERRIEGIDGIDVWEIPLEVLREAITNAVMHRDYGVLARGQQIAVDVYPDRIEVINPGGLWGTRTIDNLAEYGSNSRNEFLSKLLTYVPRENGLGAVCENMGSGVKRMISAMQTQGLPPPDYSATSLERVVVRLDRIVATDTETDDWLDALGISRSNTYKRSVMALVLRNGEVSVESLQNKLGMPLALSRETIRALKAEGLLVGKQDGPYHLGNTCSGSPPITETQEEILQYLHADKPKTIRQLAEESGRTIPALRQHLKSLIEGGYARPTAPPSSKNRAYVKN